VNASYTLRLATEADQARIRALIDEGRINPMSLDWQRFLVAESNDDQVVACGQIKPHGDGSHELASIAVTEAWRGHGLARAIIDQLIAGHQGDLYLMCRPEMSSMYVKFGFEIVDDVESMPRYFRRISKFVGAVASVVRQTGGPTIMKLHR
jgi:N-acetylglutamate synthase-like GNAT family acetyltransferase